MKANYQEKITGLVNNSHCVVIGDRKWKVIDDTSYENMEEYDGLSVCNVYSNELDNTDSIELGKFTQHLWDGYWCEKPMRINYSENKVNREMISYLCILLFP